MSKTKGPRILIWDIESTNLAATFGDVLCIGYKWFGEKKVHVLPWEAGEEDDAGLVARFAAVFATCDYHVTWYGARFDLPFIRTKMLEFRQKPLPPKPHLDLWRTARNYFKAHSNRLAAWEQLIGTKERKSAIAFRAWKQAMRGDPTGLAEVYDHCKRDVKVLEEVFEALRPWLTEEPMRGLITGEFENCPSCGSSHVHRKGKTLAKTRRYQEFQCQDCGRYFRGTKAIDKSPVTAVAA